MAATSDNWGLQGCWKHSNFLSAAKMTTINCCGFRFTPYPELDPTFSLHSITWHCFVLKKVFLRSISSRPSFDE
jgi:hypothetical protein